MKKLLFSLVTFLAIGASVSAQQRAQYSQYVFNNYLLNPALTGVEDYTDARMGYRRQWVGMEGAPVSFYASIHTSLGKSDNSNKPRQFERRTASPKKLPASQGKKNYRIYRAKAHHGIGALMQSERTGPLTRTGVQASYAFHLPVSKRYKLAMGVASGVVRYGFDEHYATFSSPNDPASNSLLVNELKADLNAGLWFYSDQFFIGASGAQLLKDKNDVMADVGATGARALQRHFYLTSGVKLQVTEDLAVIPSAMVKYASPSPVTIDASARAIFRERVWAGASYRHQDAVAVMIGAYVSPTFDIGYSYDATTSKMKLASAGSHEIMIGMKLKNPGGIMCPQWLW